VTDISEAPKSHVFSWFLGGFPLICDTKSVAEAWEGNERLSGRLMEVKLENRVEAVKQREQAEKGRKRPRRSFGHDTR